MGQFYHYPCMENCINFIDLPYNREKEEWWKRLMDTRYHTKLQTAFGADSPFLQHASYIPA